MNDRLESLIPRFLKHKDGREALTHYDGFREILAAFDSGRPLSEEQMDEVVECMEEAFGNFADEVATFYIVGGELDYPVAINCFAGIYWVRALEGDDEGYFDSQQEAQDYAFSNWTNLVSELPD